MRSCVVHYLDCIQSDSFNTFDNALHISFINLQNMSEYFVSVRPIALSDLV